MSFPPYEIYKSTEYDWLGTIPTSWRTQKFRHLFKESSEKIEGEVFGEMLSVSGYRGIQRKEYDDENRRRSEEDLVGYRIVRKGQLVVNTMWLNYAGLGFSELDGHVSPAYRSYWPKSDEYSKYLHYLLRSEHYVNGYTHLLTGVRPNSLQMSRDNMMSFPVVLPPKAEQIAIATFLDRETAKIDALIAEQKRLIELLQEKRQAVISHAVTKGLNPDAPMKESGVEWAKKLPEHWTAKHLKRNVRLLTEKTETTECPVGLENLEGWTGRFIQTESDFQSEGVGFEADDILFGKLRPYLAKVWLADRNGEAIGDFHVLRPYERVNPRFIQYQLLTREVVDLVDGSSYGAKMPRASWGFLGCLEMPSPPAEEQLAIACFLDRETAKIDALIAEAPRAIKLLQERRLALISAAVTGQIDVRGLVEVGSSEK